VGMLTRLPTYTLARVFMHARRYRFVCIPSNVSPCMLAGTGLSIYPRTCLHACSQVQVCLYTLARVFMHARRYRFVYIHSHVSPCMLAGLSIYPRIPVCIRGLSIGLSVYRFAYIHSHASLSVLVYVYSLPVQRHAPLLALACSGSHAAETRSSTCRDTLLYM
jgi:hypothetical protein